MIDRHRRITSIIEDFFLYHVASYCQTNISSVLRAGEFYSKPFRAWYENKSSTFLDIVPSHLRDEINAYFKVIYKALDFDKDTEITSTAIICAHQIISAGMTFEFSFEEQWTRYNTLVPPSTIGNEDLDDYETLDEEDYKKSVIHRFLYKLARYYTMCRVIVHELVARRRSGHELHISIETVPTLYTTSTPCDENEHPDLDSFLRRIGVDKKILDPKKVDELAVKWEAASKTKNLVLHPEMQLALFYATNPELSPIKGYIGTSKKCCWCCDFVLTCVTFCLTLAL
jgi:hypothetical protein